MNFPGLRISIYHHKKYRLALKSFLREGKDGYDMFKECPVLLDDENGPQLIVIVENHFKTIQKIKEHHQTSTHHRPSLVPLAKRNKLLTKLEKVSDGLHYDQDEEEEHFKNHIKESNEYKLKMHEYEVKSMMLKPIVENRIVRINDDKVHLIDFELTRIIKISHWFIIKDVGVYFQATRRINRPNRCVSVRIVYPIFSKFYLSLFMV